MFVETVKCRRCNAEMKRKIHKNEEFSISQTGNICSFVTGIIEEYTCPDCGHTFDVENEFDMIEEYDEENWEDSDDDEKV